MVSRALGGGVLRRAAVRVVLSAELLVLSMLFSDIALARPGAVRILAQQSPYQAEITTIDSPSWLEFFSPIQDLPVWAAAAVLAAVGMAGILIVTGVVRLIWRGYQTWSASR